MSPTKNINRAVTVLRLVEEGAPEDHISMNPSRDLTYVPSRIAASALHTPVRELGL